MCYNKLGCSVSLLSPSDIRSFDETMLAVGSKGENMGLMDLGNH